MPFELRPYPTPTLKPEGDYLQNGWKNNVYPTAERFGVKIILPNVSPQPYTHLAFEGFQYAKEYGKGNNYNHRVLKAFFQEEQDIGKVEVLTPHLDTVFPEGTNTTVTFKDGKVYAPGIADDGRGLAVVLTLVRALDKANIRTKGDIIFGATVLVAEPLLIP